ncbi:hypothetical protein J6590_019355 [Homalodisca vitripennis]|nr:hypothetical protein J6590_019355 [Homalodisca vitripennis]
MTRNVLTASDKVPMSDVLGSSGIEVDTQEAQEAAGEGGLEGCTATGDRPESDETPGASAGAPTTAAGNLSPVRGVDLTAPA